MTPLTFSLDPRLQADTVWLCDWPLSKVLLMNDARFPWLILVPRRSNVSESFDLPAQDQTQLWLEVNHAAELLKGRTQCKKINIGALGNVVAQLHVHVIARNPDDAAGLAPVWGRGPSQPYNESAIEAAVASYRPLLRPPAH